VIAVARWLCPRTRIFSTKGFMRMVLYSGLVVMTLVASDLSNLRTLM
jgi:hypothetical protein